MQNKDDGQEKRKIASEYFAMGLMCGITLIDVIDSLPWLLRHL
jgi:hypothetical protein